MQDYKKLQVWHISKNLAKNIYLATSSFPKEELFGLTSQMRRSAISIPANIAEGCSRKSSKDFINFLRISLGSVNELLTFIELSKEFSYIHHENELEKEAELIKVMLLRLISRVDKKN
jgi:four helix bundle protein